MPLQGQSWLVSSETVDSRKMISEELTQACGVLKRDLLLAITLNQDMHA